MKQMATDTEIVKTVTEKATTRCAKKFKRNTLVVFDTDSCRWQTYEDAYKQDFPKDKLFVFMGAIQQNPSKCLLFDFENQKVIGPIFIDNFKKAPDNLCQDQFHTWKYYKLKAQQTEE